MVTKWKMPVGIFVLASVILSLYLWSCTMYAAQPSSSSDKARELVVTYQPNGEIIVRDGNGERVDPVQIGKQDPIEYIIERSKGKKVEVTHALPTLFFTYRTSPDCTCKGYGNELFCVPKVEGCPPR